MKIRRYTFLVLLLSALTALADKKMTIRNTDTDESFEVMVPDGLKIYEYNSNWSDSIPYLIDRARYGEPWAYEALGDCYRYGNGGVERSIFKAIGFYELAGADIEQKAEQGIKENPNDQLGNLYRIYSMLDNGDKEGALCTLDTLYFEHREDTDIVREILRESDSDKLTRLIERDILSPDISTDKTIFTIFGCMALDWFPESFKEKKNIVTALGDKLPFLYDLIAVKFFRANHDDMDPDTIARKSATAITFLEKADMDAMLSRKGAEILYRHYQSEIEAGRMAFDTGNMNRLATLARLPESETFIFTDKQN